MIKTVLVFCLTWMPAYHPLHVSVTEINYDEKEKAIEIMVRIFADDLETALRRKYNAPELDILNPKGKTLDQMMQEYFSTAFSLSLDGKKQTAQYLGNEKDSEAFVFYIEVTKVKKWSKVQVVNTVLTELFDDQSNLVHVTWGETVKSLRLNRDNPAGELSFGK